MLAINWNPSKLDTPLAHFAVSITIAVLPLALLVLVVGVSAAVVKIDIHASDMPSGTEDRLHPHREADVNEDEYESLAEQNSIYLPLVVTPYTEHPAERAALMALYNHTNGDGWDDNSGWGTDVSYCTWYGVSCDITGHVKIIDLS